jgi:hypothetical protein
MLYPKKIVRHFSTSATPSEIANEINAWLDGCPSPGQQKDAEVVRQTIITKLRANTFHENAWLAGQATAALASFEQAPLKSSTPPGGTTGPIFMTSSDTKFIVKSLRRGSKGSDEAETLDKIWGTYLAQMNQRGDRSLLPRLLSTAVETATLRHLRNNDRFFVMHNINPTVPDADTTSYSQCDLKGMSMLYQVSTVAPYQCYLS